MPMRGRPDLGLLGGFAAVSLAAVGGGAVVCGFSDVPVAAWGRNIAAWGLGALVGAGLAAGFPARLRGVTPWAAAAGLLASLFAAGQQGVHRWVDAGPAHLNVAMLLLPGAYVALAGRARTGPWPWVAAFAALILLVAQPDASQALALAAVTGFVAATSPGAPALRLAAGAGAAGLAILAWMRPDPLAPVPEVEGIAGLAWSLSPAAAVVLVALMAATAAAPAVLTRKGPADRRLAGQALSLGLLVWTAAPFLGAFPAPFAGLGPSPILGAWIAVGLLAGWRGDATPAFTL